MWWIYGFSMAHPQQKWKLLMGTSSIIRGNCSLPWLSTSKVSIYILLCGTFGSPRCPRCGVLWGLSNFPTNAWGLHTSERKKGHEGAIPPFQSTTWWGLFTLIFLFVLSFFHKYGCMIYSWGSCWAAWHSNMLGWWSFNSDVRFQICYSWKVSDETVIWPGTQEEQEQEGPESKVAFKTQQVDRWHDFGRWSP